MTPEELKKFETEFGKQATDEIQRLVGIAEKKINDQQSAVIAGLMTMKAFDEFKGEAFKNVNDLLAKLDTATTEQGNKINSILEKRAPDSISFEDFLISKADEIKKLRQEGKYIEFSAQQLKVAGVTAIGSAGSASIDDMTSPPGSPYIPGLTSDMLQLFEIVRNPNFISNRVDLGRTNQSILAWANETAYEGLPELVAESGYKPLLEHKFQAAISRAKKIAGYIHITEEFEQDLPGFATLARRMLQDDVVRRWDDFIMYDIIAVAPGFDISALDGTIYDANRWDALLAMMAQIYNANFTPNTIAINPYTNVLLKTAKAEDGVYLIPPFAQEIQNLLVQANKVTTGKALVGDLKQFKVDIYKDFYIKIGLINDDLIKNQFAVVGEIRYHSYISDNRKRALVYDVVGDVAEQISGAFGSNAGSVGS